MRTGVGFDAHRFDPSAAPLILGGVTVAADRGVAATSDGDVLAHAIIDAVFGAAGLGDMGDHFPSSDPAWHGSDSLDLMTRAVAKVGEAGFEVAGVDATVIAESVRVSPHRGAMRERLAAVLGVAADAVSVKATTTDGMGAIGADEGIAALAVATLLPT